MHKVGKKTKLSSTDIDLWDVGFVVMSVTYEWLDANSTISGCGAQGLRMSYVHGNLMQKSIYREIYSLISCALFCHGYSCVT